ncbi:hypothetical protein FO519_010627 [Halicephalobus sp. NKZ332]|nr:hypothetical protein FO519_010627 [Halicephalobus sp. NKZ332]
MRTKTSKELYDWLNKKVGDTNDFRKFLSQASSDTVKIRNHADSLLPSQTPAVRDAWLEFRKYAKTLASGKGQGQIQASFDSLPPQEKEGVTKLFNILYGFNFTRNQLYRLLH